MSDDSTYIPDGYELGGTVAAVEHLHASVRFRYRPLTVDERDEVRDGIETKKAAQHNEQIRNLLAERIRWWDVTTPCPADATGQSVPQPAPIAGETIRSLHPQIFDKLYGIICEQQGGDEIAAIKNLSNGVWLMLNRPALLKFSCDECQRFVYDMQTGERETTCGGLLEVLRPVGPSGKPEPPCDKCPKGSPDREHEFILTEANRRTYQLYLEVQATAGARLTKSMRNDRWLLRNLSIIHRIAEAAKEARQEEFLAELITHLRRWP